MKIITTLTFLGFSLQLANMCVINDIIMKIKMMEVGIRIYVKTATWLSQFVKSEIYNKT